jgi:hypothetical protein
MAPVRMKPVPPPFLLALIVLLCLPLSLLADGGDEILPPHPVDLYPGSVQRHSDPGASFRTRLTKDRLGSVRKFYDARKLGSDRWVETREGNRTRLTLNTYGMLGKREASAFELSLTGKDAYDGASVPGFVDLMAQVKFGRHTEAEYQALQKRYGELYRAFYRPARDEQGREVGEDALIVRRAEQAAHPGSDKPKAPDAATRATGRAKAQDLKARMRALKARGDIAGMMRLASEGRKELPGTPSMEEAAKPMERDTWDIWVKCLQELETAAYWTQLEYAEGALPNDPGK